MFQCVFAYARQTCGALKYVLLLEWPVCYFYWSHKLLTVSVMPAQVSLI